MTKPQRGSTASATRPTRTNGARDPRSTYPPAHTRRCECEHQDHFVKPIPGLGEVRYELVGHAYGIDFDAKHIEHVHTPFGTFAVCPACRETCMADYVIEATP